MQVIKSLFFTGRNDSSGVRFHYTSNIRQYDAGTLAVGDASSNFLVIPPKQKSWLSVGFCPKECNQVSTDSLSGC